MTTFPTPKNLAHILSAILSALLCLTTPKSAYGAATHIPDNGKLIIDASSPAYSTLELGDNVTLLFNGGTLEADVIKTGRGLRLAGCGDIRVRTSFTVGENSHIDLSAILLELSQGRLVLSPGSALVMGAFPVRGGEVEFMTDTNGNGVTLSAPVSPVFGSTKVKGRFHSTEAYPEWYASEEPRDWAPLINEAFSHTADGSVRLSSRVYNVLSTIYVPTRGRLCGTSGLWKDSRGPDTRKDEDNWYGTKIMVAKGGDFQSECLMLVNFNRKDVESGKPKSFSDLMKANCNGGGKPYLLNHPWILPTAYISDIAFRIDGWSEAEIPSLCCILVAGEAWFEKLSFQKFRQGIVWTDHYSDLRKVTRCQFGRAYHQSEGDYYLLDFNFLGDALICEGNSFDSGYSPFNRHLRVRRCNGGNISSNIINGDVLISGCKGLRYSDNHMENGAQIVIRDSEVELSNNFIEKGVRPSVVIENSDMHGNCVTTLRNNAFLYYSQGRDVLVDGKWTPTATLTKKSDKNIPLSDISDYDIEVRAPAKRENGHIYYRGPRAVIDMIANYRYWITTGLVSLMYTSGVAISQSHTGIGDRPTSEGVESFNRLSHLYSTRSSLSFGNDPVISSPVIPQRDLSDVSVSAFGLNNNTRWYGVPSTYTYSYRILNEAGSSSGSDRPLGTFTIPDDLSEGVLFTLHGASEVASTVMVRMIRRDKSTGREEYADIPLIACNCFYDNGVTVGAYKWILTRH